MCRILHERHVVDTQLRCKPATCLGWSDRQEVDEAQADALYAAFHDGSIMTGAGGPEIEVTRQAGSWFDAIISTVRDVEGVPGLRATGAGQEDLVSLLDIAHRAHRSREAVRLWAAGKRGPGGFPAPAWRSPSGAVLVLAGCCLVDPRTSAPDGRSGA